MTPPDDAAAALARDRQARAAAQTRFDRPLVLEAGAGTGKTTTLIARLLAWCLGPGWDRAAGEPGAATAAPPVSEILAGPETLTSSTSPTGSQALAGVATLAGAATPAAPTLLTGPAVAADEVVAARVLRRVVALTFTEAAAAEMAERAARELAALARGGRVADWMGAAALPAGPDLVRRARALVATLDHLSVETIHAYCLRLLASYPLEARVHPVLQVDVDGSLVEQAIAETVEGALRSGYGSPGDPHLLALAAAGCGPREVAEALAVLVAAGLPAAVLERDPFAGDGWARLVERLVEAASGLHQILTPRLAGSRLPLAAAVEAALAHLAPRARLALLALSTRSARSAGPALGAGGAGDVGDAGGHGDGGDAGGTGGDRDAADATDPNDGGGAGGGAPLERLAEELRQAALQWFPANLRQRLADWGKGRLVKQEQERLGEVRQELEALAAAMARLLDQLERIDPARLRTARLALAPLLGQVREQLTRRGIVSFDDLLRGARRLLAAHPEVRTRLRRGIDQLLVDEFQDTDATQCEVLRWLALDGPPGERPGLFLVGDPKQSIYGWRSADLRAYAGFVAAVVAAGGVVLPLVENFRSLPAILDEVTRVMAPVMRERAGVQPPHAPLVPCERRVADAPPAGGGRAAVEHWISWPPDAGQEADLAAATALEAEAIAGDLAALHADRGMAWREAAILLRSTGDLDVYLDALRRRGIPFAVGRDTQYFRRREIIDAAALVRAVLDPGDHLALVTLLRSPMVGVPDAALIPLWRHQLPRLVTDLDAPAAEPLAAVCAAVAAAVRDMPPGVPGLARVAGWDLNLISAIEHLAVLRQSFAVQPIDLFVERLRRLFLLDAIAAARHLGAYRLANLDRFFRLLLVEIERGGGDATAVLRALRVKIATGREAEEGRPLAGAEDAVSVLTIHGAKGLDFTHVYLPQLHKPGKKDQAPPTAVGWDPPQSGRRPPGDPDLDGWEYCLFGNATPDFDRVEERRLEVESAERVRTLYVAMTRAKDRLVLAACWPRRAAAPPAPEQARSHLHLLAWRPGSPDLQWLWEAAGRSVPAAQTDSPVAAVDFVDSAGVAWRFPAFAAWAAPAVAAPAVTALAGGVPAVGALAAPAAVAAQAADQDRNRAVAAARMASPFGAAASEEAHAELREEIATRTAAVEPSTPSPAVEPAPPPVDAASAAPDANVEEAAAARAAAMAAGAAFHRAVELWDLGADVGAETERQRAMLASYLAAVTADRDRERGLARASAMLDRFVAGGLAERLCQLAPQVIARELPVLLAPPAAFPASAGSAGSAHGVPAGFVSGTIDLLYRDPASGALVIADYKTDDVAGAALASRAAIYASQGAAYVTAIQAALALPAPPRFELWFVIAGQVVAPAMAAPGRGGAG